MIKNLHLVYFLFMKIIKNLFMADGSLNGQVVLVHENYETTAQAMEYLAPYMKSQGWQIVTVSEMFKANGKTMYNGTVYNNIY